MYSIVPQNVCVTLSSNMDSLQRPKSVNLTCPRKEKKYMSEQILFGNKIHQGLMYWFITTNNIPSACNKIFSGLRSLHQIRFKSFDLEKMKNKYVYI